MSNLKNSPNLKDATLQATTALPAAAANNNTASFDIGAAGPHRQRFELELAVPTLPALVDDKTIIFEVEHSDDDSTFTDLGDIAAENGDSASVTGNIQGIVTGSETPGTPGPVVFRFAIPSHCKRYVRINQAVLTAGGDNTGVSTTLSLVM